jgi:sulfoxide reductase heme-binding subunit YedZ
MATATTSTAKKAKKTDYPKEINKRLAKISSWYVYAVGLIPAAWYFYLGAVNNLGANPIQTFEHLLGEWTIRFFIAVLLVTPVRDLTRVNFYRFRRTFGLLTFWYAVMHFTTYLTLDKGLDLHVILTDITKRPYIIIGLTTLTGLLALAVTSNNWSILNLGKNWGRLHKLVYVLAPLGILHYLMAVKSYPPKPLIYGAIIAALLAYRLVVALMNYRRAAYSATAAPNA